MEAWREELYRDSLEHSYKGTTWKKHKYLAKRNGRYIYASTGNGAKDVAKTAFEKHQQYKQFSKDAKEQGRKIHRYEYDPWNAPMVSTGPYVTGPETDQKIREFDEWRKKQPAPKMSKEDFDYLEQHHLILTERSEQIAKEKEEKRKAKKEKVIATAKSALSKFGKKKHEYVAKR